MAEPDQTALFCKNSENWVLIYQYGKEGSNDPIQPLKGTKWKLAGIVDETGSLNELEPKDCEECYTLTFITNEKAGGGLLQIQYI